MAPVRIAPGAAQRTRQIALIAACAAALLGVGRHRSSGAEEDAAFLDFLFKKEDPVVRTQRLLLQADAVAFDVDSTIVTTEGIDLLAKCYGVEEAVVNLTRAAMEGGMKFEDAMKARLELMNPTRSSLEKCVKTEGKPQFTKGVIEVVKRLHARGTHVYLVSGGFRNMIEPIADKLEVPKDRIFANTILFNDEGNYAGFDESEPTSHDGGKPAVLKLLKKQMGYKTMLMVGDGATDLQARPPAKAFIGFGGVKVRSKVQAGADWFVHDFAEVLDVLPQA